MALLSKATITGVVTKRQEQQSKFGDTRPRIEPGIHVLTLSSVTIETAKESGNPMIVIELSATKDKQPFKEFFVLSSKNEQGQVVPNENGLNKAVLFLVDGFGHEVPECNTEIDILNEFIKFKGKTFKGAVQVREKLFTTDKGVLKIDKTTPKLWYVGSIDKDLKIKPERLHLPLNTEDQKKWLEYQKYNPAPAPETEKKDNLPF